MTLAHLKRPVTVMKSTVTMMVVAVMSHPLMTTLRKTVMTIEHRVVLSGLFSLVAALASE